MKTIQGYYLIKPEDLQWRPSNLMKIPNADYLERTGSENIGARLWRLPPKSANTLHKHIRSEEFYFVLEGTGRMYHVNQGKTEALQARFRDYTDALFKRHNMKSVGYWVPEDAPASQNLFIYILEHPSRQEAEKNWAAFQADPEW